MKTQEFLIYIMIMAGTTYLIRVVPFVAVKEKIKNRFICSFLYYIPYAVLAAMTFPAVLYATDYMISAAVGLAAAVFFSMRGAGLTKVAVIACIVVFVTEQMITILPI